MVSPEALWEQMERIAQDVTVRKSTKTEDSYGRTSEIDNEESEIRAFIDYSTEKAQEAVRSGAEVSGTANIYVKAGTDLTPTNNTKYTVQDETGDKWNVKTRLQSIHNENREAVYNVYEITLIETKTEEPEE